MKILLDNQIFHAQRFGGISRYFCELIKGLKNTNGVTASYYVGVTNNIHFNENGLQEGLVNFFPDQQFPGRKGVVKLLKPLADLRQLIALRQQAYNVFVPTYYNPYFLKHIGNKPYVLTVYDMIHELFPHYFPADHAAEVANKKILIEKATKIIAISESTKRDILKLYPAVEEAKIEVVYLSHSIDKEQPVKQLSLPADYVLFVGKREGYKNFNFFLNAIQPLLKTWPALQVVCTGPAFSEQEKKKFQELNVSSQLIHYNAADEDLKTLYSKALFFVFPSEYEGFGIPILEAMASACPVIASNASSFPEVAGDAALYFELGDSAGLCSAMEQLLQNIALREDLRQRGLAQASTFSWDKTVAECLEVFKSVS